MLKKLTSFGIQKYLLLYLRHVYKLIKPIAYSIILLLKQINNDSIRNRALF